jgi:hypothetical protein
MAMLLTISRRLALAAAATLAAAGAALAQQDGGAGSSDVPLAAAQIGSACAALHNASGATAQVTG